MTDQMNSDRAEILYASFPLHYTSPDQISEKTHEPFLIWHGEGFSTPHTVRAAPHTVRAVGACSRTISESARANRLKL